MKKQCSVGGQAVMEGVMMRGVNGIATAVRKSDGEIIVDVQQFTPYNKRNKFFSMPIIRGFIALVESLIIGIKTLNYSASFFEEDEEKSKFDIWIEKKFRGNADNIIIAIVMGVSFLLSISLFVALPTFIANLFKKLGIESSVVLNIIEGIIRVGIFLSYIYIIGKMDDINRFFQYHGAEHKTIFCYENSEELNVENVAKYSRFHPRCGTNFLFLVMIVSIIIFSFTGWNSLSERMMYRIILIPVVSGTTYEIIKWLGKSKSRISKIIAAPGLALQKLTTREPDTLQIEVAIKALKGAEGIED
ncbi:DUF1385 domain-containing protein [Clostridium tetani]|uniref:DUF1385 domain-containing protein n=1 Tax=Clostridium tetani TaxID=1513 RepID=UPI00100BF32C|nr:DUF1385 domain-containing protein [Clostridium tetani]RXI53425.1 DUF1385 domain-containing protein [Clostridium tetani]RXI56437.1 DUF1385 domain-containing protein [Clostridium tetani]RXM59171.1 DUF1385 domain-containing protein [Clostridium tetani]BDR63200.1 membrane protein [Clostridium tetani]